MSLNLLAKNFENDLREAGFSYAVRVNREEDQGCTFVLLEKDEEVGLMLAEKTHDPQYCDYGLAIHFRDDSKNTDTLQRHLIDFGLKVMEYKKWYLLTLGLGWSYETIDYCRQIGFRTPRGYETDKHEKHVYENQKVSNPIYEAVYAVYQAMEEMEENDTLFYFKLCNKKAPKHKLWGRNRSEGEYYFGYQSQGQERWLQANFNNGLVTFYSTGGARLTAINQEEKDTIKTFIKGFLINEKSELKANYDAFWNYPNTEIILKEIGLDEELIQQMVEKMLDTMTHEEIESKSIDRLKNKRKIKTLKYTIEKRLLFLELFGYVFFISLSDWAVIDAKRNLSEKERENWILSYVQENTKKSFINW